MIIHPQRIENRMWRVAAGLLVGALVLAGCAAPSPSESPTTAPTPAQTQSSPTGTEPPLMPPPIYQDKELAALLRELIVEDLPLIPLTRSDDIVRDCGKQTGACYLGDQEGLFVTVEFTDFRLPELLAHEYLHHIWFRDALDDDAVLVAALQQARGAEEGLGALIPPWQQDYVQPDGSILPTELFSYACTGLRPDQLASPIAERCAQYLKVDALPINQTVTAGELLDAVDALRQQDNLAPLQRNAHAEAASAARAELFQPYSQVPLDEYPESVAKHLKAGCSPSTYGVRLTRPYDPVVMMQDVDRMLKGKLTSTEASGIGIALAEFDYIDAREMFGDRTIRVNGTLIVATVCK